MRTLIASAIVLALAACSSQTEESSAPEDLNYAAFDVCTGFVKDRLKAPATAEFRNYFEDDGEVRVTGGPTDYTVASTVDSENGFGAKIRSTFVCEVTHLAGEHWLLNDITIT